jgi:hypothetical protein
MKNQFGLIAGIAALIFASLACALPNQPEATSDPGKAIAATVAAMQSGGTTTPGSTKAPAPNPTSAGKDKATLAPTVTAIPAPALPVGLRQGLASLNSYHIKFNQTYMGPTAQDKTQVMSETDFNSNGDRTHVRSTNLSSSKDNPSDKATVTERYQIGNKICTLPAEEGQSALSAANPMAEEMVNATTGLMDLLIYVEKPVLVGEESVNGVKTRHYQFKINSLGKKSGAEVTKSSGEYWVAVDGQYLVQYSVILETRSAPQGSAEAQVMHAEVTYSLTNINKPIAIEMPAECK